MAHLTIPCPKCGTKTDVVISVGGGGGGGPSTTKDAERYRWLKAGGWITAEQFDSTVEFMGQPEDLDAAIDGAMEYERRRK